jgi:hypothetical protein
MTTPAQPPARTEQENAAEMAALEVRAAADEAEVAAEEAAWRETVARMEDAHNAYTEEQWADDMARWKAADPAQRYQTDEMEA